MKTKRYYTERAAHLRELAREAQTEGLRKSCLKAAEAYQALADTMDKPEPDGDME